MNNHTADIHTLTGAYAVDALDDVERARFEEHLAVCEACQQEVAEFHDTAAHLAAASYETPPPGMRDAVMARIDQTRQEPPRPSTSDTSVVHLPSPWYQRLLAPAAAVLMLVVIGLTAVIANMNDRLDELETLAAPVAEILTAPDVTVRVLEGPDGAQVRLVASPTRGEGVFLVDSLAQAPEGRTYQLWLIDTEGATPAGLLNVDEQGRGSKVMTGDMGDVVAIGVTVEPEGGSPQPTTEPVVVIDLADTDA